MSLVVALLWVLATVSSSRKWACICTCRDLSGPTLSCWFLCRIQQPPPALSNPLGDQEEFTSKSFLEDARGTHCLIKIDFLKLGSSPLKKRAKVCRVLYHLGGTLLRCWEHISALLQRTCKAHPSSVDLPACFLNACHYSVTLIEEPSRLQGRRYLLLYY